MIATNPHSSNGHVLKVVKSKIKRTKKNLDQLYINTLSPGFNYKNEKGEIMSPKKCALLK